MGLFSWLKFQRVSLFLYLGTGSLLLVYALGFISDVYIFYAYGNRILVDFYHDMQIINSAFLRKAVVIIIFALILLLLELAKYPAGFFTLVIVLVITAISIFFCINSFILLLEAKENYASLDLSSLNRYIERGAIKYKYSTLTYDLGLGGYVLFLLSSLVMAITVIRNAFAVKAAMLKAALPEGSK